MKILAYGPQFNNPIFYRRWEILAQNHSDVDLTLLTFEKINVNQKRTFHFGNSTLYGKELDKENFHIRFIKQVNRKIGWTSPDFKRIIQEIKPDIFYVQGQFDLYLLQIIYLRNKYFPSMKIVAFSMRGPAYNISAWKEKVTPFKSYLKRRFIFYYYCKIAMKYFNKNVDAVFCHYPKAVECFKQEGYNGPIYMQTQVGVNPELFHEDSNYREEIRNKLKLGNSFVFGSGTRFIIEKGVDDIIEALPNEGDWKYVIIGDGKPEEVERIKKCIEKKNLPGKIIMTGQINLKEMPKYWNALDCVVHVPKTSIKWEETFSIALVQAMIIGKPIIASNSGSVPYQVGPNSIIVQEGDINAINEKMVWMINHQKEAKEIGEKMKERAYRCFSIQHLSEMIYDTFVEDIIPGKYDSNKFDMTQYITNSERKNEE